MSEPLSFETLIAELHRVFSRLPNSRAGNTTSYAIKDAALAAFSVFFTQSPSFLAHQRTMKSAKGRSNAETLFGLDPIPCDNQIRT